MVEYIADQYIVGDIVVAKKHIIEDGFGKHVEGADPDAPWLHAAKGQRGIVIYVDPDDFIPCVRFFDSGTATDCGFGQIEFVLRCHSITEGRYTGMGKEQYSPRIVQIKSYSPHGGFEK